MNIATRIKNFNFQVLLMAVTILLLASSFSLQAQTYEIINVTMPTSPISTGTRASFSLIINNTSVAIPLRKSQGTGKHNTATKYSIQTDPVPLNIITNGPLSLVSNPWSIMSVSSNLGTSTVSCSPVSTDPGEDFSCTALATSEVITVEFESIVINDPGAYSLAIESGSSSCVGVCNFNRNFTANSANPEVSISSASGIDENDGNLTVTVGLTGPINSGSASVELNTIFGTADAGDLTAANGTITFNSSGLPSAVGIASFTPVDNLTATLEIPINDDTTVEPTENFSVGLSNSSPGLDISNVAPTTNVSIFDNDTLQPNLSISVNNSINEADGPLVATVSIDSLPTSNARTILITAPGVSNAASNSDFFQGEITIDFNANGAVPSSQYTIINPTTVRVNIAINNDTEIEADETFDLFFDIGEQGFGLNYSGGIETITIIDDDSLITPTVSLAAQSNIQEAEGPLLATVSIDSFPASIASVNVVSAPVGATPASAADFEQKTTTINFDDNGVVAGTGYTVVDVNTARISYTIADDTLVEADESFSLTLTQESGVNISSTATSQNVTIEDNDQPPLPTVQISASATIDEASGPLVATLNISSAPSDTASVEIMSTAGSPNAASNDDFEEKTVTVNFDDSGAVPGSGYSVISPTSVQISFSIFDDSIEEVDEVFDLVLQNETGLSVGSTDRVISITIEDNDAPIPPINPPVTPPVTPPTNDPPQISASTQRSFSEDSGQAIITFSRSGDINQNVSFDFTTVERSGLRKSSSNNSNNSSTSSFSTSASSTSSSAMSSSGLATAGKDYSSTSATINWPAGDGSNKSVSIPIIDDNLFEGNETFQALASNLTTGASFSFDPALTITIIENDIEPAGEFNFSAVDYDIKEDGINATITVTRSGGSNGAISVNYASSDDSATAGEDYNASAGTLSWADKDTTNKTFSVTVNTDILNEPTEQALLSLSNPSGGATLGTQANATLNIINVSDPGAPEISKDDISVTDFDGDGLVEVVLDATGKVISDNPIDDVSWLKDGNIIANGMVSSAKLPIGNHPLRVIATDNNGKKAAVDFIAEVKELDQETSRMLSNTPGLNPEQDSVAGALDDLCPRLSELGQQSTLSIGQANLRERCEQLRDPDLNNDEIVEAIDQIAGEEAEAIIITAARFTNMHHTNLRTRFTQLRRGGKALIDVSGIRLKFDGGSLSGRQFAALGKDVIGGAASGDEEAQPEIFATSRLGLFLNGNISYGERDPTKNNSGFKLDIEGITAGMDYRFTDSFIGGVAVGYSNSDLDYANDGGILRGGSTFYSAYTSFYSDSNYYIDSSITYADSSFDVTRNIRYRDMSGLVDLSRGGTTNGEQLLTTVDFGWDYSTGPWTFGPNGSLSYSDTSIDGYAERGDSGLELEYSGQDNITSTLGLGFHSSRVFLMDWGVLIANLTGTYYREFKNQNGIMRARFVHDPFRFDNDRPTRDMLIISDIPDRNYLSLGFGLAAQFKYGLSGFIDYQSQLMTDDIESSELAFGLRYEAKF